MDSLDLRREALILQRDRLSRVNRASTSKMLDGIRERLASVENEICLRDEKKTREIQSRRTSIDPNNSQGNHASKWKIDNPDVQEGENLVAPQESYKAKWKIADPDDPIGENNLALNSQEPYKAKWKIADPTDTNYEFTSSRTLNLSSKPNQDSHFEIKNCHSPSPSCSLSSVDDGDEGDIEKNHPESKDTGECVENKLKGVENKGGDGIDHNGHSTENSAVQSLTTNGLSNVKQNKKLTYSPQRTRRTSNRRASDELSELEKNEFALQQFELGKESEDLGHLLAACDSYRLALSWCPHMAEARYNLAMVLTDLGKTDEALDEYSKVITVLRNNEAIIMEGGICLIARAYYNQGLLLDESGDLRSALACYASAVKESPSWVEALHNYTVVLAELRDSQPTEISHRESLTEHLSIPTPVQPMSHELMLSSMSTQPAPDYVSESDSESENGSISTGSSDSVDDHDFLSTHSHHPHSQHHRHSYEHNYEENYLLDSDGSISTESDSEEGDSLEHSSQPLHFRPQVSQDPVPWTRRPSVRNMGETQEEFKARRRAEVKQERALRPPPPVPKRVNVVPRVGGNLSKSLGTVNLRHNQRITALPSIIKEREERRLSALHMANSHVVGYPSPVHGQLIEPDSVSYGVTSNHHRFEGPDRSYQEAERRRRSLPTAPSTIETPFYTRQQHLPRESCVVS